MILANIAARNLVLFLLDRSLGQKPNTAYNTPQGHFGTHAQWILFTWAIADQSIEINKLLAIWAALSSILLEYPTFV